MRGLAVVSLSFAAAVATSTCGDGPPIEAEPGDPIPGLSGPELERFVEGRRLFDTDFDAAAGLGPRFNQTRCSSCHDVPVIGGGGVETVVKATAFDEGACNDLRDAGGPLFQSRLTSAAAEMGLELEVVPTGANARSRLNPPALFAGGLIESIADADILARHDPDDRDKDGLSGRAVRTSDGLVGRFGLKAEHSTLVGFVAEALLGEMGLTSSLHGNDGSPRGAGEARKAPEVTDDMVAALADFSRFLAPVRTKRSGDDVGEGRSLFESTGCAGCHTPTFRAGPGAAAAAEGRSFSLYSDLLLHDMGVERSGHCTVEAAPTEWRTAPLAGLSVRGPLMHDGRAGTLTEAISLHGGEGSAARSRFDALTPPRQRALLAFLETL